MTIATNTLVNAEMKIATVQALDELMKETPIDKISVSSICNHAGISRATFYRNFHDKFGIVQWYVRYIHSLGANRIGRTLNWYDGYYTSELMVMQHHDFFVNAAKSQDYNSLDQYAPRLRKAILEQTITDYVGTELTERLRFQIQATVQIETHLLPAWHYGKFDCSLEDVCTWMIECIPRDLFDLLNTPVNLDFALPPSVANARVGSGAALYSGSSPMPFSTDRPER